VVQFGREGRSVARRMRVPDDRWAFVVPLAVPGPARWNGFVISGEELIVCTPRSEGYAFDPAGMDFAVLSMSPWNAPDVAGAAVPLVSSGSSCLISPAAADWTELRRELSVIRRGTSRETNARRRTASAERLRALLVKCLSTPRPNPDRAGDSRSAIVRRAETFFRSHLGEPVSIAQLSAVAEVSERSLRNAFYRVYSVSPKRYLRLWQLHQVQSALRAADAPHATVTGAATDQGFYELGRFAGEYKALFGEHPSDTLHRRRHASRGAA
jgi:AraC-like DNA-binding protein